MLALLSSLTGVCRDDFPDPRSPLGRWHPLEFVLALAVCAFTAAGRASPAARQPSVPGLLPQAVADAEFADATWTEQGPPRGPDRGTVIRRTIRRRRRSEPYAGQVHRLATLATIVAGQGDAEAAAGIAGQMLDKAAGMESCRIRTAWSPCGTRSP